MNLIYEVIVLGTIFNPPFLRGALQIQLLLSYSSKRVVLPLSYAKASESMPQEFNSFGADNLKYHLFSVLAASDGKSLLLISVVSVLINSEKATVPMSPSLWRRTE